MAPLTRTELTQISTIIVIAFGGMLGIDIHLASMPYIMKAMHTTESTMQQSISLFLLGLGSSQLIYGPVSDKYGRKPLVLFGLSVYVLSNFAACSSTEITPFLICRFWQGIGAGGCLGLCRTMVADLIQGERLSIIAGYFTTVLALSPLAGPSIGGYIEQYCGWQMVFFSLGSFMTLAGLTYTFLCGETNKHLNHTPLKLTNIIKTYWCLFKDPLFIGSTILAGTGVAATMTYATISPFIFHQQFRLSPVAYGWVTACAGIGAVLGRLTGPILIKRFGSKKTVLFGLGMLGCASLILLFTPSSEQFTIIFVIAAVFLGIFSQAVVSPNAMSFALSPFHNRRGAASAVYGCNMLLLAYLASVISIALTYMGFTALMYVYFALFLIGLIVYFLMIKPSI